MHRNQFTTTSTGTGDLTLSVVPGFQSGGRFSGATLGSTTLYTLLAANGVDWEFGYAELDGTTLRRGGSIGVAGIIESSNANAALNLPAGTHTVIFTRGSLEGALLSQELYVSGAGQAVAAGATEYISFSDATTNLSWLTRPSVPVLPQSSFDPAHWCPIARFFRATFSFTCDDAVSGDVVGGMFYYHWNRDVSETIYQSQPLPNGTSVGISWVLLSSKWFGPYVAVSDGDGGHNDWVNNVSCSVTNTSASSITVDNAKLTFEYLI